ncbi:MAG TPA: hypothetical protein VHR15_07600 [Ktedonobacterales bacterium]|jgi:hypothetical protein|nr:hypothetical protein [Ktedonobacterales bacterium]
MKLVIALLSLGAIVLLSLAFIQYGPAFAAQAQACQPLINSSSPQAPACLTSGSQAATAGLALYLAGIAVALLAWLLGLVKTAHIRRWFWFIVVFLLSPLGSLLYGVVGPSSRAQAFPRSVRGAAQGVMRAHQ